MIDRRTLLAGTAALGAAAAQGFSTQALAQAGLKLGAEARFSFDALKSRAEAMAAAAASLPRLAVVETPEQAAAPLAQWLQHGDVVLLKASRGVALERLLPLLPQLG